MKKIIFALFSLFALVPAIAQDQILDDISFYSDVMVNATNAKHRVRAHQQLESLLPQYLANPKRDVDLFKEKTKQIQILKLGDCQLYSYMVDMGDNNFEAFGYVVNQDHKVTKLTDVPFSKGLVSEILKDGQWIPGVYYHAIPMAEKSDTSYLLFSYMQLDQFTKRKTIDVFTSEDEQFYFGKKVLKFPKEDSPTEIYTRQQYFYSADVAMSIQHQTGSDMIIFDHLIQVKNRIPGQGITQVPDGSYDAFIWEDGQWVYKDNLYDEIIQVQPSDSTNQPKAIKKDIFGKKMER